LRRLVARAHLRLESCLPRFQLAHARQIAAIRRDFDEMDKTRKEQPGLSVPEYHVRKHLLDRYDEQAKRTALARRMLKLDEFMEWLPTALLAYVAAGIIVVRLTRLLSPAEASFF